jgi:hypothetical protein
MPSFQIWPVAAAQAVGQIGGQGVLDEVAVGVVVNVADLDAALVGDEGGAAQACPERSRRVVAVEVV